MDTGYGFKCLDPTGATYHKRRNGSSEMLYALPHPGEKWGPWMEHPQPAEPDGASCGPGRYHVMLKLSAVYAPTNWWPWFVQWSGQIGADNEKVSVAKLRLRRISPAVLARALRPPFNWGYMADLRKAGLYMANLRGANLREADLRVANLREADLRGAFGLETAKVTKEQLEGALR